MTIEIGNQAPDFTLKSQHGEEVTLSELRGKPVALVFFPFAFSGICTGELCEIRDNIAAFAASADHGEVQVLAISCDHFFSNRAFADAEGLTFPVLSDFWPHGEVSRAYGIFNEGAGAPERGTYLLDAEGIVRWKVEHPIGEARDFEAYRAAIAELF
ncbi:peroxiredoxin [Aeromicrobium sp. CTD01-1L150]|uniref:peroxiredoxin n=1 Tax=Aeromicrobium sp. CTD01-1L150 TaxID=3341830 RepID=UPI0035C2557C